MKTLSLFLVILTCLKTGFSQEINGKPALAEEEYLKKSKTQKTTAWVLLGSGIAIAGTGLLIASGDDSENNPNTGSILFIGGSAIAVSSIPFFIFSGQNKKNGTGVSINLKVEKLNASRSLNGGASRFPAMSLKLPIGNPEK